jgi:hypothetical protein
MRKFVNAIVNVIRRDNRRNRVIGAVVVKAMTQGVDALRASGPEYSEHDCRDREHHHAPKPGQLGLEPQRGGLFLLAGLQLDPRSGLKASPAWQGLSSSTRLREASQMFAAAPFMATATAMQQRPQAAGRGKQRVAITAARLLASA